MKKKLLMSWLIVWVSVVSFAQEAQFEWMSPVFPTKVNRKTRSQVYNIERNAKNEVFTFGHFGSLTAETLKQTFLGREFTGAPYTGTSSNRNMLVTKLSAKGDLLWAVNSNGGDVDPGASVMIPTRDGGAFLALKVRHADKNADGSNIILQVVDNDAAVSTLKWEFPIAQAGDGAYHTVYQVALLKLSAEGKVEKLERVPVDFSAQAAATHYDYGTTDGFYFYGGCEDSTGHLYLAGNLRKPMTFGTTVITPHNTADWNGDSQKDSGSSFIVKLDADGNYVKHFSSQGKATYDNVSAMTIKDDHLFIAGLIKGVAKDDTTFETVQMGNVVITPNEFQSAYAAQLDTDLTVNWCAFYPFANTQSKKGWKIDEIAVNDEALYLCGAITGASAAQDEADAALIASTGRYQNGYVLKCNVATGAIEKGHTESDAFIGNTSAVLCGKDKVFTFSYKFGGNLYLDVLSKDLVKEESFDLSKNGGMQTSWDMAGVGDTLIVSGVVKAQPEFLNTTVTFAQKPSAYTGFVGAWTLPGKAFSVIEQGGATAVESLAANEVHFSQEGAILSISSTVDATISIYNLTGERVASRQMEAGETQFSLARGLFLVRVNARTYKVAIR